ncbi:hypothetical protein QTP88_026242 [Uroleucon formosanum]
MVSNIFISKNRYESIFPTNELPTENSAEIVQTDSTNEQSTDNSAGMNTNIKILPPSIFIQAQLNFNTFCIKLKEITDSTSFECKTTTKGVKLQTFSFDSHRAIVKFLKSENVSFHSYQSKESKPFRIVIRNLHPSTDKDYINKELSDLGFQVKNITNVLQKSTKIPLPFSFIDLLQSQSNHEIFKLNSISFSKVKVEAPYTKKKIPQCNVVSVTVIPVATATTSLDAFAVGIPTIHLSAKNLVMNLPNALSEEAPTKRTTETVSPTRILNNINELQFTLHENKIDIAMISETHLTHKNFLNIHGYHALKADHPDGSADGGAVLLISNKIHHSPFLSHT